MKFLSIAAVAASALSSAGGLVAAAPLSVVVEASKFEISVLGGATLKIPQVYNKGFIQVHRGPRALAKAYAKFGVQIPDELQQLLLEILAELGVNVKTNQTTNAGQGEVAALPQMFDTEYLAAVQIGTPAQTLMLDFDTGSSDLWVFSSDTPRTQQSGQKIYNVSQSSTAQKVDNAVWSIRYGDGSGASGIVYTDTVSIGGVTVTDQAVESASQVSGSFTNNSASSGLLGLGFDSINQVVPQAQKTFFSNAMETLAMPLFTANLKQAEAGNYNFGFIDSTEFTGPITFVPVNNTQGFWGFDAQGFQVGDSAPVTLAHEAIADTGTTLLLMPDDIVEAYYAQVTSAQNNVQVGGYVFDCSETLPSFTASIGGYSAVIPGDIIKFAPADTDSFDTAQICFGGIQSSAGLPFAIYGDIFLKSQFVVFHGGENQLGFAAKPL
ncbi:Asp-domain-containing protein [Pleurostoma richardsiae]|uniref:Asp-domain-containing protein n=1 Tax=Pleurostoma richardsiae TaxID=41990 RepID=A0AA38RLE0_9PEZI|nr:Asp-domain-containing protein [Pleurostoma richardsiae]